MTCKTMKIKATRSVSPTVRPHYNPCNTEGMAEEKQYFSVVMQTLVLKFQVIISHNKINTSSWLQFALCSHSWLYQVLSETLMFRWARVENMQSLQFQDLNIFFTYLLSFKVTAMLTLLWKYAIPLHIFQQGPSHPLSITAYPMPGGGGLSPSQVTLGERTQSECTQTWGEHANSNSTKKQKQTLQRPRLVIIPHWTIVNLLKYSLNPEVAKTNKI